MTVVSGRGNNIRNVVAAARKLLKLKLENSRIATQSGGEDGLYCIHLTDGTIVEVTIVPYSVVEVYVSGAR